MGVWIDFGHVRVLLEPVGTSCITITNMVDGLDSPSKEC